MSDRRRVEHLPKRPMLCSHTVPCVYRVDGVCDEPWINHANSDAACFRVTKWKVNEWLSPNNQEPARHD
jgi:hypothetical protein